MPDGSNLSPMPAVALDYARRGIPVFPCNPGTKRPLTEHGFKDASTDPAVIDGWWQVRPGAMIGIPTGEKSGCIVLDIDEDDEKGIHGKLSLEELIQREGELPETALAITPRGGRHYYFRHPGREIKNSASKIGVGIDVRGDGGYIILPPSVRADGGEYRWLRTPDEGGLASMPEWLIRLAALPVMEPQEQSGRQARRGGRSSYAEKALDGETNRVRSAANGTRNDTLNQAAFNLGQLVGSGELSRDQVEKALLEAAAGYAADDGEISAMTTIASGVEAGIAQPRERKIRKRAADKPSRGLPVIQIGGGCLPINVDQAESYLIENDPEIYQRGDMVVRPAKEAITIADQRETRGTRLVPIKPMHLAERLTRIIDFQKYDKRSDEWFSTDCPFSIAATYLERVGNWHLSVLTGIVDAPTLRPDGSIIDEPGYDKATGILYAPSSGFYPLPPEPTKEQARAALDFLCRLIAGFPFVDADGNAATGKPSPSRSVALSAILTAMVRRSIPHAPLHAFTAPVMGSGKSKLVDIASMIATGHEAPVLSLGKTEEEMEKRLGAALIGGDVLVSFDNCEQPLGGELLCQALTQSVLKIRILGKSQLVALPTNATFCATGNNLVIAGDMTRRTIIAGLDPKVERPEQREFASDPVEIIRSNRADYVSAALAVLRAFIVAGTPRQGVRPLGSFEGWSRLVRDALLWLGEPDPCATMERVRAEDPQTQALSEVLIQWKAAIGSQGVSVKRVIEYATEYEQRGQLDFNPPSLKHPDFREALLVVAGDRGAINSMKLGRWLGKNKGRIVNGLRIEQDPTVEHGGAARWKVG